MCSDEDRYIPIEEAVEAVRNDVPSLMQLIRDKVEAIIKTRAELDSLLKRVDQEKVSKNELKFMHFVAFEKPM